MVIASHCVGFTFPGMIEDPGSFSGMDISPNPQRGPEASQRMSFEIFISEAASVSIAPCAKTISSCAESAANLLPCERKGSPVSSAIFFTESLNVALQKTAPAAKLLPKSQRHGVLQVSSTDLHDVMKFFRLRRDRIMHVPDRRNQRVL